jgi:hypothetical protein
MRGVPFVGAGDCGAFGAEDPMGGLLLHFGETAGGRRPAAALRVEMPEIRFGIMPVRGYAREYHEL